MSLRSRPAVRRGLALIALITAAGMLAACSTTAGSPSSSGRNPTGTLHFIVSSSDASDAGFRAVNAAFQKKYPSVKIVFDAIPNANWPATSASRLTAGNADLTLAGPKDVPSYVPASAKGDDARAADAGVYVDLTKEPFMKNLTPTVLKATAYKGKQYDVPTGVSYYSGIYYNKAIFAEHNLQIPTTWSQFVVLCTTLKSAGISPMGIGGKDGWPAGLTMIGAVQGLYPTAAAKDALQQGLYKKTVKLTDSKPTQVLQRVNQIYGFAQPNFAGVSYQSIPSGFANGSFAMTADGTWNEPTLAAAVGSKFDFGYFPLPASDNAADNATLGGKIELTLAVPSNAKNKTAALAYLDFFTQPANYAKFVKLSGFASAEPNIPASAFLTSIAPYTKTFSPAWDTVFVSNPKAGAKAAFPFNYQGLAPLGTESVSQAAAQSQQDWVAGL
jgi:raffinose/stachyose/melibiose transport system substrate-binding protein